MVVDEHPHGEWERLPDGRLLQWYSTPEKIERLAIYCRQDIRTEREIDKRILPLRVHEQEIYLMDQRINDRGVFIDRPLCEQALKVIDSAKTKLDNQMADATGWLVTACTQNGRLLEWVRANGVEATSLAKAPVAELLARHDLPPDVREALEIRKDAAKSSTAKIKQFLARSEVDNFMRGLLQYHGAGTGRWAARGAQLQNLVKNHMVTDEDIPAAIAALLSGDSDLVDMLFGSAPTVVSECLRGMIASPPGKRMLAADYSAIEARVIAWLADQQEVLDVFRNGGDIYCHAASGIYGRPITKKDNPDERQVGKVACIAEGELTLTDLGLVPIEDVTPLHKLWDGGEWVSHDGAYPTGFEEVMTYDGLTATEDHSVFSEDGREISIGGCAREQVRIAQTGFGGEAIRYGGSDIPGDYLEGETRQVRAQIQAPSSEDPMRQMWGGEGDKLRQLDQWEDTGLPVLQPDDSPDVWLAGTSDAGGVSAVHGPEESRVDFVWRTGDKLRISDGAGFGDVDFIESRTADSPDEKVGNRSYRQQPRVRSGEPTIRDPQDECEQPSKYSEGDVLLRGVRTVDRRDAPIPPSVSGHSILGQYSSEADAGGTYAGRDCVSVSEPTFRKTKGPVWDILNAGPRYRFTVSDRLVSNCLALGFAGGVGAFAAMAAMYRVDIEYCYETMWASSTEENRDKAEQAYEDRGKSSSAGLSRKAWIASELIKLAWRSANPKIVAMWKTTGDAAKDAVKNPGTIYPAGKVKYLVRGSWLFCQLPSGRAIAYPYPKMRVQSRVEFVDPQGNESSKPFRGTSNQDILRQVEVYLAKVNAPAEKMNMEGTIISPTADEVEAAIKFKLKAIGRTSEVIQYKGLDPKSKKWSEQYLWTGTLVENNTQGIARDIMAEAMLRLEKQGYEVCLTVHDEVVAYAPNDFGSLEEFTELMCELPAWAPGLPLTASGWEGQRYKKDNS